MNYTASCRSSDHFPKIIPVIRILAFIYEFMLRKFCMFMNHIKTNCMSLILFRSLLNRYQTLIIKLVSCSSQQITVRIIKFSTLARICPNKLDSREDLVQM